MVFSKSSDGSTFGGYPLACVAGSAALKVFEDEKLTQNGHTIGISPLLIINEEEIDFTVKQLEKF